MGHDEGLQATYRTQKPPWIGLWSSREYKGRPDWWKEAGLQDRLARNHKIRLCGSKFREEDPDWFDPKVPDGTSLSGPMGLDSRKHKNLAAKADQPGNLEDFQQKHSPQFKALAEKFNLSKEHPGAAVNPSMNTIELTEKSKLGANTLFPSRYYTFGPRFFDSPLNEGTFWKGLAAAKYTAFAMIPYTMVDIRAMETVKVYDLSPRTFLKRYMQLSPLPLAVSFSWAIALSTSAVIREKDDVYNHLFSSLAVGSVVASAKDNVPLGITLGLTSLVLGVAWQYARITENGLQGKVVHPDSAGIWGGPLAWKLFSHGDKEVSKTIF